MPLTHKKDTVLLCRRENYPFLHWTSSAKLYKGVRSQVFDGTKSSRGQNMNADVVVCEKNIWNKIHLLRGLQIMLDTDLAEFYKVETKALNQAVKRNNERFPDSFMFQISTEELKNLKSQIVTSSWGGRRNLPYAFTEQGVAMLSGVLRSDTAVRISIQIMSAFVTMRRFLASNAQLFQRLDVVERKQIEHDQRFKEIFDAYTFASDLIRSAQHSIILIDDSVLTLFSKKNEKVQCIIFTKEISKQLSLDLKKYNSQYPLIEVKEFMQSHDRFLIIDNKEVYHFGASLKDLGKKWFAFSKFDKEAFKLLDKLGLK